MSQIHVRQQASTGGLYLLLAIGFGVHFYRHADTFSGMAWAVLKAIFWPVPLAIKVAALLNL